MLAHAVPWTTAEAGPGIRTPFNIRPPLPGTAPRRQTGAMYHTDHFLAIPEDVIAFAWSAPMRELAQTIGISDVGLRKLLRAQGIVTPAQGHWNRVKAGRPVPAPPAPQPRRTGEIGRVRLDGRFRKHVPDSGRIPVDGPFASKHVPEDLGLLGALELKALGKVAVPRDLARPHPGLAWLLQREDKRRRKFAESEWSWDRPKWDGPLAQRQLRLADALLKALARRGHDGSAGEEEGALEIGCTIGDTHVTARFTLAGDPKARGPDTRRVDGNLPAATPLVLAITGKLSAAHPKHWQDQQGLRLERQVARIAADLIVAGEARFRESLVEARESDERMARWKEERRVAERERLEQQRIADLRKSGELLRQATEIRTLVVRVKEAVEAGEGLKVSADQLARWESWALCQANQIDPVRSKQVLSHLSVPALDLEQADGSITGD